MAESSSGRVAEPKRRSALVNFLIRLVKEKPLGTVCGIITLLLLLIAIFPAFLAPYGMNETHTQYYLAPPSARFWLGSDSIGRDVLSRVIFGAQVSVIVGLAGATVATIISVIIGLVSGYIGGKLDLIVQRVVDSWMCIPSLVLMLVIMSIVGRGIEPIIIVVGISWGITGSRILRSAVIAIKEDVYVAAAVAIGCSTPRILIRHILPNIMAPTIIVFTMRVPAVIMMEASLSFLGFGIAPPTPSWGSMLSGSGRDHMFVAPWVVVWPGLALAITVYSINMFGDAVRDLLDPRLRGGVGRYGVRAKKEAKEKSEPSPPEGLTKQ